MSESINHITHLPENLELPALFEAYAMLTPHGNDFRILEALSEKYPHYAEDLVRYAAERDLLPFAGDLELAAAEEHSHLAASRRTLQDFLAHKLRSKVSGEEGFSSLAELAKTKGYKKQSLAEKLGLSLSLFMYLDKRRLAFKTIPRVLIEHLARELEISFSAVAGYLNQTSQTSANASYKAQGRPAGGGQRAFSEAVAEDQTLSAKDKRKLLDLI